MNKEIVIATSNPGKLKEFREILSPLGYTVYGEKDLNLEVEAIENGKTYEENAYIKAKAVRSLVKWPVIADDSGIEIASMNNEPGIYSARYAKSFGSYPATFKEIFKRLEGKDRAAAFHCCICLLETPTSKPLYFEGVCPGFILNEPHGLGGFGYDPIFHCSEGNLDFGTCKPEEKDQYSHRHKALVKLLTYLSL